MLGTPSPPGAVLELHRRGEVLNVTPQVLVEFRGVATRPVAVGSIPKKWLSPLACDRQDKVEFRF